jgi:transcriptional regulator with GAF, ATPase, and Fis domain
MSEERRPALVEAFDEAPSSGRPSSAEVFRSLAEIVYVSDDFTGVYQSIVDSAPHLVEGCDHASLMLRRDGRFFTVASSDEIAAEVDAHERELGEGPCLDAILDESVFHDADLTDGSPWPRLAERVLAETPVRSMAGFRIRTGDEMSGALNLFSDTPGGLTVGAVDQGIVLASFISVALVAFHERRSAQTLRDGLESNREIGKAMGLMMAFHKVSDVEAFAMLRRASQDLNIKLKEVAKQVVDHHNTR